LVDELKLYIKNDLATPEILFPNQDGGRLEKNNYSRRVIAPLRQALGLKKLDLRMIRRGAATLQMRHGTIKDVQGQTRHTSPTTLLAVYAQTIPEGQQKMVESYWGSLTGVPSGAPVLSRKRPRKKRRQPAKRRRT
jgi:integrase